MTIPGIEFDAVVFDLFDTLVCHVPPPYEERLSTHLGISEQTLHRAFDVTRPARSIGTFGSAEGDTAAVMRACGVAPNPEIVRELTARHLAFLAQGGVRWYDDAPAVLSELRSRGVPTAVISNCDHWTRVVVDAIALADKVDVVILSFEVGMCKPDARIYRLALDRLGIEPRRAVFVDDKADYCAGANAAGLHACLLTRDERPPEPSGFHATIADLRTLLWP